MSHIILTKGITPNSKKIITKNLVDFIENFCIKYYKTVKI